MLKQSVISKSGQSWKLVVAIAALIAGSFAPMFPSLGLSWTAGTIIAVIGYAFGMISIRCGNCSSRWFWEAAMNVGLYKPLFKGSACPGCGHDFDDG
jgi:hypothetical protein